MRTVIFFMNEQVSGSISSVYPADYGDIEVQGSIEFAVNYIQKLEEFHIFVVHCRDLAVADTKRNRSDPLSALYNQNVKGRTYVISSSDINDLKKTERVLAHQKKGLTRDLFISFCQTFSDH